MPRASWETESLFLGCDMLLAILSDTHSREAAILKSLQLIVQRGPEMLIHCGDIEDAKAISYFPSHTHFVFGNCDDDREGIRQAVAAIGATLHEPFGHLEVGGLNLGFLHGDHGGLLGDLLQSEAFDFVFHGHTHQIRDDRIGPTRVINPGALHRARIKTFALLDTATRQVEWVTVE